jgi:serine/threonine-protein kinase
MTPSDRWRKMSQIFHEALPRNASERSALLRHACGDDVELQRDVESLLAHQEKVSRFFDIPTLEAVAELWGALASATPSGPEPAVTWQLQAGEVLDKRYEIEDHIAAGGMGEVYRARRIRLGDLVAIKVIRAKAGNEERHAERFMAEARMCAALHHPHIVSVLDFAVEPNIGPYLVMEYLNGRSLSQTLREKGPLPIEDVYGIAVQVAAALEVAHAHGIVHRDLKPGNVMAHHYTAGEIVHKVIDFGIGNLQREELTIQNEGGERIAATLGYASPEQLTGRATDQRSDVYSFGATIYELLTGHRPFTHGRPAALIIDQLFAPPAPPSRFRRDIQPWADAAILKALEKKPEARWATASDFVAALCGAAPVSSVIASPARPRFLDRYQLGALIASGRLGSEIYQATDRATNSPVAIRVIRRGQHSDWSAVRARFMREARTTPVKHPSILQVRDYGEEPDAIYVVTDLIQGRSLREVIDRDAPLSWPRGFLLVHDLIGGIRALHSHGVLAFGLTPAIIRVAPEAERERLVISAAGVAEIQEVLAPADGRSARGLELGGIEGHYLAPELLIEEKPDGRTDIYTIGAIGYEVFTGRRPFSATTLPQLVAAAFTAEIVDPRAYAPSLPEEAAHCLLKCLARRPDERFFDATELERVWVGIGS